MKLFSVIGNPIMHSKSPRMHNNAIKNFGFDALYTRYNLEDEDKLRDILFNLRLSGANITLPFKEKAFKIADVKDESIFDIKAANTLIIKKSKIYAYNTDILGFLKAIENFENLNKVLILGAGGTARAIAYALKYKNIKEIHIANRNLKRFSSFKDFITMLYEDIDDFNYDMIINTTSAGLFDENLACDKKILEKIFNYSKYAFEVIYNKETPFIKLCKKHNLIYKNGLEMLLWQGIFAFELFFEIKNQQNNIKKFMLEGLNLE
ncbi:shikimate dehydrogenase [Campylobacter sp. 2018MI35]|uniref:shikimate dehydrogenase n=1 Tax=Campylobacter sp. 2018MI34 TaxID=2800582 RepID=UPI0019044010|nr:shikimate dehydrogenase [Campylobacter sp. 2018MI34]MBK1991797.1 shikimate dehydrogenase [Campylobacter sp. 2018MI34]